MPVGKAQPLLVWRHPSSGSELGCQLSSSVLQAVQCLGTHGVLLAVASGEVGLHCSSCTSEGAAFGWSWDFL